MKSTPLAASLAVILCLAIAEPARAQTQVPGTPYLRSLTTVPYVQANVQALQFSNPDEAQLNISLPFPFKYYDQMYSDITVGTNGAIAFFTNASIPYPNQVPGASTLNNFIAPWWDDLEINPSGLIGTAVEGTAPQRAFVIEWRDIGQFLNSSVSSNFQLRLYEGPAGQFDVNYGTISGSFWSATVGMEDEAGGRSILFAASNCTNNCSEADFTALSGKRITMIQDPGIELIATSVSGPQFAFLGAATGISIGMANLHGQVIGPFGVRVVASSSPDLTSPTTVYTSSVTLNAFQSAVQHVDAIFPASLGTGLVYLGLQLDNSNAIPEVNELNNTVISSEQVRLLEGAPDLTITRVVTSATEVRASGQVPLTVRVTNVGGEPATNVDVSIVLSSNPVITPQDAELTRYSVTLAAGASDERDLMITIPANASSGAFHLGALADPEATLDELSESNNGVATPTTINITGGPIQIVTTTLPAGYVRQSYIGLLSAVGGSAMRTWTITQGQLPTGIGLVASTGELYGRPTHAETQTFTVEVSSDNHTDAKTLTLAVVEPEQPLTIVTRDIPPAIIGQEYAFQLVATGGTQGSTLTWSATDLPPGITVSPEGLVGGIPTMEGPFMFTVSVTDGTATATRELSLTVRANSNLLITPAALPHAMYGQAYSFQLESTGGIQPITYLIDLGALPEGLTMSPTGLIAGTPMQVSDMPFRFVVEARDSAPGRAQAKDVNTFELFVDDVAGFQIGTETLPTAYVNEGYDTKVQATGGVEPYTWSVSGDLPPGLSASTNSTNELLIAGQPTQLGVFTLTIKATDSEGRVAERALAIQVIERPAPPPVMTDSGGCGCTANSQHGGDLSLLALFALVALRYVRKR